MESNDNSVPDAEATPNVATSTAATMSAPSKPRYGSWMLVTRKEKPAPPIRNHRQNKGSEKSAPNRGNQYSVLADIHDNGEPPINRNSSEKRKSKSANNQRNTRANQTPILGDNPVTNHPPRSHNSAGDGGRQSVSRGRGRGAGLGSAPGHGSVIMDPSSVGGSVQTVAQESSSPILAEVSDLGAVLEVIPFMPKFAVYECYALRGIGNASAEGEQTGGRAGGTGVCLGSTIGCSHG
nr:LINE-type retrotransposon LIb DNA [Ipomoea batatas]